jgi:hypothetical protein
VTKDVGFLVGPSSDGRKIASKAGIQSSSALSFATSPEPIHTLFSVATFGPQVRPWSSAPPKATGVPYFDTLLETFQSIH